MIKITLTTKKISTMGVLEMPSRVLLLVLVVLLTGCSYSRTYHAQIDMDSIDNPEDRQIAIFLDGTQNDQDSETNVSRLYHIVKNQNAPNLHVFYNEGVGSKKKYIGAGTGWGIRKDVSEAYAFLADLYEPGSKVSIFGFSRGAYSSRVLVGMIYSIGIYDLSALTEEQRYKVSRDLFKIYKSAATGGDCSRKNDGGANCVGGEAGDVQRIRRESEALVQKWNNKNADDSLIGERVEGQIALLGLWDTVEALGAVPTVRAVWRKITGRSTIEVVNPNRRYIDQVCNVDKVLHAMALDDNREFVFTPISIKSDFVVRRCENKDLSKVKEVWFAGAHADVGGGYTIFEQMDKGNSQFRDNRLSGISLNWMISELKAYPATARLLTDGNIEVPESASAFVHDGHDGSHLYQRHSRQGVLKQYAEEVYGSSGKTPQFSIHDSVFVRLANLSAGKPDKGDDGVFGENGYDSQWYLNEIFEDCIKPSGLSYVLKTKEEGCQSISRVKNL